MTETIEIHAVAREHKGKNAVKKLYRQDMVPAILYGHNIKPLKLSLTTDDINRICRSGSENAAEFSLYNLRISGSSDHPQRTVMIKEVQREPLKGRVLHVDFFAVRMDEAIIAPVHIHLTGKPEGVKLGGILRHIQRDVKVKSLPADMPTHFDVDVSGLQIGDSIHISDLPLPENVVILDDPDTAIVNVLAPITQKDEEEAAAEEAAAGETAAGEEKEQPAPEDESGN